ncbi:MAG TPA: ribosome silencing factor [Burkholderiaceae bacterium]|nr:ribosome silencing factor [Burkholderiaceae bacterium]
MDIRKLQRAIVDGLEDVKAHNIVVFNTEHLSPLFERVIVASGTSNRQTKALANSVRETVKARGLPILSVEGAENGEWIIVDCGAAVAHIMQPVIRDYYRLEEIWGGKSVKMKIDGTARPAVAEGGSMRAAAAQTATRAGVSSKAPPKRPGGTKSVAAKRAAATKRSGPPKKRGPAPRKSGAAPASTRARKPASRSR